MFDLAGVTRRGVLGFGINAALLSANARFAFAATPQDRRLIVVILRGALDGLSLAPPYGDPAYPPARRELAYGLDQGAFKLGGTFALHPGMPNCAKMYSGGEALIVHAVASPYRDRSHFDGQNVLENGAERPYGVSTGWLNRAPEFLPDHSDQTALSIGPEIPFILQGPVPVGSWSQANLPDATSDLLDRVAMMYEQDPPLRAALAEGRRLGAVASTAKDDMADMKDGGGGKRGNFLAAANAASALMKAPNGPQIVTLEAHGWDTHAGQIGRLKNALSDLDAGLSALKAGLGHVWDRTVVLCITEFGRTVGANGTGGTDHGTGAAMLMVGGAVSGGRVVADWPGLASSDLYQNRDLKPTIDLRNVVMSALGGHFGLDPGRLTHEVFPGAKSNAVPGLIKA